MRVFHSEIYLQSMEKSMYKRYIFEHTRMYALILGVSESRIQERITEKAECCDIRHDHPSFRDGNGR